MNFKHKVWWNKFDSNSFDIRPRWSQTQNDIIVAEPAASQQQKNIFFLATSALLQVSVPVPVLKTQVPAHDKCIM